MKQLELERALAPPASQYEAWTHIPHGKLATQLAHVDCAMNDPSQKQGAGGAPIDCPTQKKQKIRFACDASVVNT